MNAFQHAICIAHGKQVDLANDRCSKGTKYQRAKGPEDRTDHLIDTDERGKLTVKIKTSADFKQLRAWVKAGKPSVVPDDEVTRWDKLQAELATAKRLEPPPVAPPAVNTAPTAADMPLPWYARRDR